MEKLEYWHSLMRKNPRMREATHIKISMESLKAIVYQAHDKGYDLAIKDRVRRQDPLDIFNDIMGKKKGKK
jgi:hypothetical protein